MDFQPVRRTGATYGKASKKVLVHDFFEHRSSPEMLHHEEATKDIPKAASSRLEISSQAVFTSHPTVMEHSKFRSSPTPSTTSSVCSQPAKSNSASLSRVDVFDLSSSEEEHARAREERDASKRRRMNHIPRGGNISTNSPRSIMNVQQDRQNNKSNITSTASGEHPHRPKQMKRRAKVPNQKDAKESRASSREGTLLQAGNPASRPPRTATQVDHEGVHRSKPPKNDEENVVDSSGHLTDHSTRSMSTTPKRKRPLSQYSDESVPSPSSLGFTSLKLTPERNVLSRRAASLSPASDEEETPRKVRSRLIDRLDAPQEKLDVSKNDAIHPNLQDRVLKENVNMNELKATVDQSVDSSRPATLPSADQGSNPRIRAMYGTKARTTYAKERSHLSETAEDLDVLSGLPNADATQYLTAKRTTSNLTMQLELEDDEKEDEPGPSKLKSIHELRKAGANNRFDREIQGLLEDMENESPSAKSIRLQALMKLIRRSEDSSFSRHILDTGKWTRLESPGSPSSDLVSATLVAINLLLLSDVVSASVAPKMFSLACQIVPRLLKSRDTLLKIASERKSNLSKSLIRDLSTMEGLLLRQQLASVYQGESIYPSGVALLLLKQTLRKCSELGKVDERLSQECYLDVSDALIQDTKSLMVDQSPAVILGRIKTALQVLEAFSIAFEGLETLLADGKSQDLGSALANVMSWARNNDENFNKHVLQAVVNLSNNRPRLCQSFASTHITDIIFSIIHDHFQTVAAQADHEQTVDDTSLELVILALVCLLNFAESDAETRAYLSTRNWNGHNYIEHLVGIFNSQASKIQEATTQEQSKVLVAVGYLSMVLCTMSLNLVIRQQITKLLQNKSFAELCNAAETFFQHLCTVEEIGGNDGSMSAFIARFNAILETVRQPAL